MGAFCGAHLDEAAAERAHASAEVIAGAADGEAGGVFLSAAFHVVAERGQVFANRFINAVIIYFRQKAPLAAIARA